MRSFTDKAAAEASVRSELAVLLASARAGYVEDLASREAELRDRLAALASGRY